MAFSSPRAAHASALAPFSLRRLTSAPLAISSSTVAKRPSRTAIISAVVPLGDDALMYASDYPHSECQFPNTVSNILAWNSVKPETQKKLFWDNASRFFKAT